MFGRYTEHARRALFFARYEASQRGSEHIEAVHILLGLLREAAVGHCPSLSEGNGQGIRQEIEGHTLVRVKQKTSVEVEFDAASRRVLRFAEEEAELLGQANLNPDHLVLGLLREGDPIAAAILNGRGVQPERIRATLSRGSTPKTD